MKFPFSINSMEESIQDDLIKRFAPHSNGFVQVGPEKCTLPASYKDFAEEIYNFEARADDVFICTFPRSGTTWSQEMIWLICNDLDYEAARGQPMTRRFPFLEFHLSYSTRESILKHPIASAGKSYEELVKIFGPIYEALAKSTSRRLIKTHLPMNLLPRNIKEVGAKVVYVARNPKDVAVSYCHLCKSSEFCEFSGSFDDFLGYFLKDLVPYGSYWKHLLEGWEHRDEANVHFMFYEDLKNDLAKSLRELSSFLEKPLKEEDIPQLVDHLQFESVKKNPSINFGLSYNGLPTNFIRRGKIGGNPEITEEISVIVDDWTKKNLAGNDFKFPV